MQKRRGFVLAVLVLAVALVAAACSKSTTTDSSASPGASAGGNDLLAKIQADGVIRVSTDPAYPPQSELNPKTGQYEGFDIDVANEIGKRLGVKVEWQEPSWDVLTAGHWNDRWDMSVGSMTPFPDRSQVMYFTEPYYYVPAVAVVHADNTTINDVTTDLDGKKIGVCSGCTYDLFLQRKLVITGQDIQFVVDNPDVKGYDTDSTALQDLSLGDGARLDAVLTSATTAQSAIDKGKPLKIAGDPVYVEANAIALDKSSSLDGQSLVAAVDQIVQDMHADGTLSELSLKWFKVDLSEPAA
jgi:polar amino acid transport system substrate-binding protein